MTRENQETPETEGLRIARERVRYAVYRKQQHDELRDVIAEHGAVILGEEDFRKFKLMQDFAHRVGDILAAMADVLQPRDFEDLVKYRLEAAEQI